MSNNENMGPRCPKCQSGMILLNYNLWVDDGKRSRHKATCLECEYELTLDSTPADFNAFFAPSPATGQPSQNDLHKAAELLDFMYDKWENGDPSFSESGDSLGNAFQLGDKEDEIIAVLNRLFPRHEAASASPSSDLSPEVEKRIAEIKEREGKASKGTWFWRKCYEMGSGVKKWAIKSPESEANGRVIGVRGTMAHDYFTPAEEWNADPNNQFIIHSRADIPFLLEQIESLRRRLAQQPEKTR